MKKILLLLPLLATFLHAQEAPRVNCQLLDFQRDGEGDAPKLVVVDASGKTTECTLTRSALSEPVSLPLVNQTLVFRKSATEPPVSTAQVPVGIKQALVIFFPSDDPAQAFRTAVFDNSEKTFPKNGNLVINLASSDIRFAIGEHKIQLPGGKNHISPRPAQRDNFNMVDVEFQYNDKQEWRAFFSTRIRYTEGPRHLFIIYIDPKDQRPRVRTYRN